MISNNPAIQSMLTPVCALGNDLNDFHLSEGEKALEDHLTRCEESLMKNLPITGEEGHIPKPIKSAAPALPGYRFADAAVAEIGDADYMLKGWIGCGETVVLFGQSGSMKSFVAVDIAFHVATGRDWCGHRVRESVGVLVVLGEGQAGYQKRLKALALHHGVTDAPIYVVPEPVALDTEGDKLKSWVALAEQVLGVRIGLVLLDTLSLMLGDADENSNADVGRALNAARSATSGRTLLFVHHNGHADGARERGAYQIRANADTRILVSRDENNTGRVISVECLKRKDDALAEPVRLAYTPLQVGIDADDEPITSIVLHQTDADPVLPGKEKHSKPLDYIRQAISITGSNQQEVVRQQFYALYTGSTDTKSKAFRRGWEAYMQQVTTNAE